MLSLWGLVNRVLPATLLEGNAMSCCFVTVAPVRPFGAAVMERTLVTSSPLGGEG